MTWNGKKMEWKFKIPRQWKNYEFLPFHLFHSNGLMWPHLNAHVEQIICLRQIALSINLMVYLLSDFLLLNIVLLALLFCPFKNFFHLSKKVFVQKSICPKLMKPVFRVLSGSSKKQGHLKQRNWIKKMA